MIIAEITESYFLEIRSRAEALKGQCEYLLTHEYASEAPKNLAKAFVEMACFFQMAALSIYKDMESDLADSPQDIEKSIQQLRTLDNDIALIGQHVQFINSARSQRVPWSIIPAFEHFANKILCDNDNGLDIMFCPLWEYNYQIYTTDFRGFYLQLLQKYQHFPGIDIDIEKDVLTSLKRPFYVIRFPSLERLNIRLHANIGHELGHKATSTFFTSQRKNEFIDSIHGDINDFVSRQYTQITPISRLSILKEHLGSSVEIWHRALDEILCDIVSCILFGPAAIFSMFDFAIKDKLDHMPNKDVGFYPPWRYRLRMAIEALEKYCGNYFPLKKELKARGKSTDTIHKVEEYYDFIKTLTGLPNVDELIKHDELTKLVYDKLPAWIDNGVDFLLNTKGLRNHLLTATELFENLPYLIERLENGIIPNAKEENINCRASASFAEIINSAWFYWLSKQEPVFSEDGSFNDEVYKARVRMNNLSLKAIEYSQLEQRYREKFGAAKEVTGNEYL